ncbi:hypothetical protein L202_06672 [Cryptococcus amylolentus CBS 6039]|uniref:Uncharacterized protein n=1 Tax=Cryptococcus amylolentus CBS 6039 TaxID=1295533 RepID=A0A1E3HGS9_9TREE|nr:hypothetical protein L202_06672 [Cryptococcus amylolentus CBS 6039]ODN75547.1 hypothetical protein L202_06672 [Cryptococcus amylolentus CBS 6039]
MPARTLRSLTEIDSLVATDEYTTNLDRLILNFPSPTSYIPSSVLKVARLITPPPSTPLIITNAIGQQDRLSLVVSPFLVYFLQRSSSRSVAVRIIFGRHHSSQTWYHRTLNFMRIGDSGSDDEDRMEKWLVRLVQNASESPVPGGKWADSLKEQHGGGKWGF